MRQEMEKNELTSSDIDCNSSVSTQDVHPIANQNVSEHFVKVVPVEAPSVWGP